MCRVACRHPIIDSRPCFSGNSRAKHAGLQPNALATSAIAVFNATYISETGRPLTRKPAFRTLVGWNALRLLQTAKCWSAFGPFQNSPRPKRPGKCRHRWVAGERGKILLRAARLNGWFYDIQSAKISSFHQSRSSVEARQIQSFAAPIGSISSSRSNNPRVISYAGRAIQSNNDMGRCTIVRHGD